MSSISVRKRREQLFDGAPTYPCCFCAVELTPQTATLEHILPVSLGGTLRKDNCELSCYSCNTTRSSYDFALFHAAMAPLRQMRQAERGAQLLIHGRLQLGKREREIMDSVAQRQPLVTPAGHVWTFDSERSEYLWAAKDLAGNDPGPSLRSLKKHRAKKRRARREAKAAIHKAIRFSQIAPTSPEWWRVQSCESRALSEAWRA